MFIQKKFEKEIKVKGSKEPKKVSFIEVKKPDGDTVVLEVKEDGETKSQSANELLKREKRQEELKKKQEEAKAKAEKEAKAKAKAEKEAKAKVDSPIV